jgi:hypothetical protein
MKIQIALSKDRSILGNLQVFDDAGVVVLGPVDCLGQADQGDAHAHNNPTRDTTRQYGNTPTGGYAIAQLVTHSGGETDLHTYGSYPSILLDPLSGDALKAKQNGRSGLMIHGGAPGLNGRLRPTHGCVRLSESDQRDLVSIVFPSIKTTTVTVQEG